MHSLRLEIRTEIKYDIEVTQDTGPRNTAERAGPWLCKEENALVSLLRPKSIFSMMDK